MVRKQPRIEHEQRDFHSGALGVFGGPAAAHARQLKGFALDAEGLSRRDSPKVEAQYPPRRTGKWCKKTRPSREGR
jgi:hypothetical protein